ncbi:MAG: ATP-binding cassette domain-containing protein [Propionibacteriaceae bacterium]|jgi:putative multiple sugar transport system ATP-binding protein|nr:ATP-binding cassette domain-containing protein [Propionibacteriaceae bacterium]
MSCDDEPGSTAERVTATPASPTAPTGLVAPTTPSTAALPTASRPDYAQAAASGPILEMRHITKEFPGVKALNDVTMTVRRGVIHAICGENGAGKSTLMKVLSGVWPHGSYSGEIIYNGAPQAFHSIRDSEAKGIAIIHQELALIPELSVTENIFLGNEVVNHGVIDWTAARKAALDLMARVGLTIDPDTAIKNLGVGQQQLIEIAKALSKDVQLLILDEPTSALNEDDSANLLDILRGLKAKGLTAIMISHKLNEIAAIADTITVIRDGRTVEFIDVLADGADENRIIKAMVGRPMDARFPEHHSQIGEVFFEVDNWTVEHPQIAGRLVCKHSSFHVRRGEIVGFAGVMGAGRTELARSIFGRTYGIWRDGSIRINGVPVVLSNVRAAIEHGVAYVPEDRKVLGLNLLDNVADTIVSAGIKRIAPHGVIHPQEEIVAAEQYRQDMRIKAANIDVIVSTLSGGNQQKVVLAKWMFTQPVLAILDEPTRGIDVGAKYEIYALINRLADEGKGVVMISSELPELLGVCDRIYTVFEGQITGCVEAKSATQESLMRQMTDTAVVATPTPSAPASPATAVATLTPGPVAPATPTPAAPASAPDPVPAADIPATTGQTAMVAPTPTGGPGRSPAAMVTRTQSPTSTPITGAPDAMVTRPAAPTSPVFDAPLTPVWHTRPTAVVHWPTPGDQAPAANSASAGSIPAPLSSPSPGLTPARPGPPAYPPSASRGPAQTPSPIPTTTQD